jgi:hypothetical protein
MPLRAPESPSAASSPVTIIHTTGTPDTIWERVGAALPDYVASWSDGVLKYEKGLDDTLPPSPPEGFRVVPGDPWSFAPKWESCTQRVYTVSLSDPPDANIVLVTECFHPETDQKVSYSVCDGCPHRIPIK